MVDLLYRWWYGFWARYDALGHMFRGHNINWRWNGCCIFCKGCPDCTDPESTGLMIWCRQHDECDEEACDVPSDIG